LIIIPKPWPGARERTTISQPFPSEDQGTNRIKEKTKCPGRERWKGPQSLSLSRAKTKARIESKEKQSALVGRVRESKQTSRRTHPKTRARMKSKKSGAPWSGFEPKSKPRQGLMIDRYTTRANKGFYCGTLIVVGRAAADARDATRVGMGDIPRWLIYVLGGRLKPAQDVVWIQCRSNFQ
jgi:hypothetical protein